ncbi:hypothetical protein SLEP1_g27343 [Rubroshorea leprosula]|uniref:non-specific serine/threonine protein kinase n=1 Tax=Rubroshorea leprosula TaxID=152421 RepID=A0AAV5JZE5_9ROSI|nr:hypothetical protein SLEP1_g27343 [Rubroshorea leprosula]
MHPLHLPWSFSFFIIITFVLIHAPKFASSVDERYVNCSGTFACGNIENIGYPFWGSDRPDYCGFPEFQLNCGDSIPEITIMSAKYHVLGINNESRLLTLARADYLDNPCPTSLINTTLNRDLFEFTPDTQEINLYYRCPQITNQEIGSIINFTCNVNATTFSSVYLYSNLSEITGVGLIAASTCGDRVVLAANRSEIQSVEASPNPSGKNLVEALEKGFGLQWNANNSLCDRCRGSGGQCGYNTDTDTFSCYCSDQPYDTVCPPPTAPILPPTSPQAFTMLPLVFLFLLIFLLSAHGAHSSAQNDTSTFPNCNHTFSCGGLQNLSYPFTGGPRPSYCGPLGFLLTCTDDGIPQLIMDSLSYRIIQVDRNIQSMTLSRSDLFNNTCTHKFANTSLSSPLFNLSPDNKNLSLFYECTPVQVYTPENLFWCGDGSSSSAAYHVLGPVPNDPIFKIIRCNISIKLPMLQAAADKLEINRFTLREALMEGFSVNYTTPNADDCASCRDSGGECGFLDQFVCICGDRICDIPGKKKTIKPVQIGLFITGGIIAGILLGGWWLLWYQRRKRIAAQSQSKDLPATPPSGKGLGPATLSTLHSESIPSYSSAKSDLEKGSTYFGVQVFSYAELEEATHNFDPSKVLGDGGFGTVYHGVLSDGSVVAVKRLYENNLKRVEQFINEIKILADIRHPNLVTLYGCTSRHSRELLLVYEYIPNGTVADHLHGRRANSGLLTWHVRLRIAIETANALAYLHSKEIIHRDVKTNNILLDNNFHVKVADFGLSRLFPNDVTHVSTAPQGTPGYVDPEYYQCYHLTDKSDVYSFGVVLIELISAKQAVDTNRHRFDINLANMAISRIQNQALHELVDPSLAFETDFAVRTMITTVAELAFQCLQKERDMRPSMEEVLGVLKGMQNKESGAQFAEVVNIGADDVGLLRHVPPPVSPDSVETEKWGQIRTM